MTDPIRISDDQHNNAPAVPQGLPAFDDLDDDVIDAACTAGSLLYRVDLMRAYECIRKALAATPSPAPAQDEPFGHFRAEPFGWTDCAKDDEGAIALYERPQEWELRKELDSANDFIKSLADLIQKYETMLGYRTTNAPEGAYALAEAKGESSVNTELDLACADSTCQHDFSLDPKSSIRICLKCGAPERLAKKTAAPAQEVGLTNHQFDLICQAIDKADTATMEGDYMLDSDDCIAVVRVMQALFDIAALRAKGGK